MECVNTAQERGVYKAHLCCWLTSDMIASCMPRHDTKQFYKNLGDFIQQRRRKLELTQRNLAATLGMSRASVANIETGRQKLLAHQLLDLADALSLPVADLMAAGGTVSENHVAASLPLPEGLTAKQRIQITKLLVDHNNSKSPAKE